MSETVQTNYYYIQLKNKIKKDYRKRTLYSYNYNQISLI